MRTLNVRKLWIAAFLAAVVLVGCSANTKTVGNTGDPSFGGPALTEFWPPPHLRIRAPPQSGETLG
jgi:hypothetical protein